MVSFRFEPTKPLLNIETFSEAETINLNILTKIAYHNANSYFNYVISIIFKTVNYEQN